MSVAPGSSTTFASLGTVTSSAGPAAAIFSPRTSTTQPACGVAVAPSNTRSGLRRIGASAASADAKPRSAGRIVQR